MLPISSPRPSSPNSPTRRNSLDRFPAPIRRALSHPWALRARTYKQRHPRRTLVLLALVALFSLFSLLSSLHTFLDRRRDPSTYAAGALAWGTHPDAVTNWGDHVGLGLQRDKVLAGTPARYADFTDRLPRLDKELAGPFYRRRRSAEEKARGDEAQDLLLGVGGGAGSSSGKKTAAPLQDRHGVLGGASVEWSSGVVGSGAWLGPGVDMRKDGTESSSSSSAATVGARDGARPASSGAAMPLGHSALVEHMVDHGWLYLDDDDRANTRKLHADAHAQGFFDTLPLRERVREDPRARRSAAEGWAHVYAAGEAARPKSALEVQLERMVRRVPVVVFSKTTCPYSKRAKERLESLGLRPAMHVIEVDQRPDMPQLKGLLRRRTNHATWPNIVVGSRSIGGADDLERLLDSGELGEMLDEVGVRWKRG
ncbi:hypothetical protein JCM9279_006436 [Rhodotorula babjevae]